MWLRDELRIVEPPQGPREFLRRFVVTMAVASPLAIVGALAFGLLGWEASTGSVVGMGLGLSIAAAFLDRRGKDP
jgi:hypothetical protein